MNFQIEGEQFQQTSKLPLSDLVVFIERELFLAGKEKLLPELTIFLKPIKNNHQDHLEVNISKIAENIFDLEKVVENSKGKKSLPIDMIQNSLDDYLLPKGVLLKKTISQILWKFNQVKFSLLEPTGKIVTLKFSHSIVFSNELIRESLSQNTKETPLKALEES